MTKEETIAMRTTRDYKARIKKAARSRGLSVAAYIVDRMESHIRADLTDFRDLSKEDNQMAV